MPFPLLWQSFEFIASIDRIGFEETRCVYTGNFGKGTCAVSVPLRAGGGLQGGRLVEGVPLCGVGSANPSRSDVVVVFETAPYCREIEADGDGVLC